MFYICDAFEMLACIWDAKSTLVGYGSMPDPVKSWFELAKFAADVTSWLLVAEMFDYLLTVPLLADLLLAPCISTTSNTKMFPSSPAENTNLPHSEARKRVSPSLCTKVSEIW